MKYHKYIYIIGSSIMFENIKYYKCGEMVFFVMFRQAEQQSGIDIFTCQSVLGLYVLKQWLKFNVHVSQSWIYHNTAQTTTLFTCCTYIVYYILSLYTTISVILYFMWIYISSSNRFSFSFRQVLQMLYFFIFIMYTFRVVKPCCFPIGLF